MHKIKTRNNIMLQIPLYKSAASLRPFLYRVWYYFCTDIIKDCKSVNTFKLKLAQEISFRQEISV